MIIVAKILANAYISLKENMTAIVLQIVMHAYLLKWRTPVQNQTGLVLM